MLDVTFLRPYETDFTKIRLGRGSDGGYVICDHLDHDCYISCGVSYDTSFDQDFLSKYSIEDNNIYLFDGNIDKNKVNIDLQKYFHNKNISITNNLADILNEHSNVFLKMDIEGFEYSWINNIDQSLLKNIKQMVIEFHKLNIPKNINQIKKFLTNHKIIHIHGNNCCDMISGIYSHTIPSTLEITMLRNDENFKYIDKFISPTIFDKKNILQNDDLTFFI